MGVSSLIDTWIVVELVEVAGGFIDPIHIARWGTSVATPDLATTIRSHYADVHVATQITNDGAHNSTVNVVYEVKDPHGKVVAREGFLLDRLAEPETVLASTIQ